MRPFPARDGAGKGRTRKVTHYKYDTLIQFATGQLKIGKLIVRHLERCQPCRQDCENAKETSNQIAAAFAALEKETD